MNDSLENTTPNENPEASGFSAVWAGASTGMKALVVIAGFRSGSRAEPGAQLADMGRKLGVDHP